MKKLSTSSHPSLACARVVCHTEHTHTGIINTCFSDRARVRARTREDSFTTKWLPLRKNIRKLAPRLKKFALALKRVLMDVPGPENLHREKIMKALKTKRRMYFLLRESLHKTLSKSTIYGGACD